MPLPAWGARQPGQLADRFSGLQEVWLIARRMDRMQELERTLPIPARCFAIDLTDASSGETLENELAARKPNVKILVNASGFGKIGTVGNLPLDDETGMVELNCKELCAVTHMVLPYMSEKQPDSPVRVSSSLSCRSRDLPSMRQPRHLS